MSRPKRGDIIIAKFDPTDGAMKFGVTSTLLVVSNDTLHGVTDFVWVCPLSYETEYGPYHVILDEKTCPPRSGTVLCEYVSYFNIMANKYDVVGHLPDEVLAKVRSVLCDIFLVLEL